MPATLAQVPPPADRRDVVPAHSHALADVCEIVVIDDLPDVGTFIRVFAGKALHSPAEGHPFIGGSQHRTDDAMLGSLGSVNSTNVEVPEWHAVAPSVQIWKPLHPVSTLPAPIPGIVPSSRF